jgi:hypothetical protein
MRSKVDQPLGSLRGNRQKIPKVLGPSSRKAIQKLKIEGETTTYYDSMSGHWWVHPNPCGNYYMGPGHCRIKKV